MINIPIVPEAFLTFASKSCGSTPSLPIVGLQQISSFFCWNLISLPNVGADFTSQSCDPSNCLSGVLGWLPLLHTKRKVVEKSSNMLSTRQLYGWQPKSRQSRQHWQPKSSHCDNPNWHARSCHDDNLFGLSGCQNRHRQIDNLKVHIVVNLTPFWTLFDNLAFCVIMLGLK